MKSHIEDISKLEKKLNIQVPVDMVNAEFNNAFTYLRKHVEIKGFRKGKTPMATIRQMYSDKVKGDVAQNLVQTFYVKALQEHDLVPAGMPDIDFKNPEENAEFSFTAKLEIQPEIELTKTEGLQVEKEALNITDEQLNTTIEQILDRHTEMEDVVLIRDLKSGDTADIDFTGYMNNEAFPGGSAQGHLLEIGSNSFIPGFEDALIGMKPGETKNVPLTFPEDYHSADLKGQAVNFEVKLNKIKQKVRPELNDEFVKKLGEHESTDVFKTKVREDITAEEEKRIEHELKNRLFKVLIKENPFEVPNSLITEQRKSLVADFENRMRSQGISEAEFAAYKEKWDHDFNDTAEFMVRSGLLIQKIAKDQKLEASQEDVTAKMQEFADQTGLELSRVREFYKGQQHANLEFQITEDKVFNYLAEKAEVKEVPADQLADKKEDEQARAEA